MSVDNEVIIIQSKKNEASFEKYKNIMLKVGLGVAGFFLLFPLLLGVPEVFGLFFLCALMCGGVVYFIYWLTKIVYDNVNLVITNKGLTHINYKNGYKNFIPTSHISSVSCYKETIRIVTNDANQPLSIAFVENASELKKALDDLIYKTEKQKEVIIQDSNAAMDEIKKYKELLDTGIITQEEFDTKKKQLLNL